MDGLTPFEKNFYVESPSIAAVSESEVDEYRLRWEITVEGKDVPKPIKSFCDVGFPGTRYSLFKFTAVKFWRTFECRFRMSFADWSVGLGDYFYIAKFCYGCSEINSAVSLL